VYYLFYILKIEQKYFSNKKHSNRLMLPGCFNQLHTDIFAFAVYSGSCEIRICLNYN